MNLQNFREILKPIGEHFWPKRKVHQAPAFFWQCDQATLDKIGRAGLDQLNEFTCQPWAKKEARMEKAMRPLTVRSSVQRLPFDCFILRTDDVLRGERTWRLIVDVPGSLFPEDVCWGMIGSIVAPMIAIAAGDELHVWDSRHHRPAQDLRALAFAKTLGTVAREFFAALGARPLPGEWQHYQAQRLRPFLFELFHPANHVVKVTPPGPGQSVQWREGRSHYLVLDRRTMAHVEAQTGQISEESKTEAIRRAAHCRRAHTRVLRHPKWGERIGAIVHVRATWVGPREWEGPDGKTYVVLDNKPETTTRGLPEG